MDLNRITKGGSVFVPGYASREQCSEWLKDLNPLHWRQTFEHLDTYGCAYYTEIELGRLAHYHASAHSGNEMRDQVPHLLAALVNAASSLLPLCKGQMLPILPRDSTLREIWSHYGIVRARPPIEADETLVGQITDGGGVAHLDLEGLSPRPFQMFDFETEAYSMVLCLAKPRRGGNLRFWPNRRYTADTQLFMHPGSQRDQDLKWLNRQPSIELPYRVGSMALFDSFCYHQITRSTYSEDKPNRIIAGIHFLLVTDGPLPPHWEYWF